MNYILLNRISFMCALVTLLMGFSLYAGEAGRSPLARSMATQVKVPSRLSGANLGGGASQSSRFSAENVRHFGSYLGGKMSGYAGRVSEFIATQYKNHPQFVAGFALAAALLAGGGAGYFAGKKRASRVRQQADPVGQNQPVSGDHAQQIASMQEELKQLNAVAQINAQFQLLAISFFRNALTLDPKVTESYERDMNKSRRNSIRYFLNKDENRSFKGFLTFYMQEQGDAWKLDSDTPAAPAE